MALSVSSHGVGPTASFGSISLPSCCAVVDSDIDARAEHL